MPGLNYTAKGKQVFDEIGKPMTREAVDADIENWHSKIKKNAETTKSNPGLKDVVDFANKGIQGDLDSARITVDRTIRLFKTAANNRINTSTTNSFKK